MGLIGFGGIIYIIIVTRRLRVQTIYQPVFEDWLFHVLLSFAAYAVMVVSACVACARERAALFLVAASALLLLFIGIHNAWDIVTYHVFARKEKEREVEQPVKSKE